MPTNWKFYWHCRLQTTEEGRLMIFWKQMMKRREAVRKGNVIGLRYGRRLRVLAKMIMLDRLHNAQEGMQQVSYGFLNQCHLWNLRWTIKYNEWLLQIFILKIVLSFTSNLCFNLLFEFLSSFCVCAFLVRCLSFYHFFCIVCPFRVVSGFVCDTAWVHGFSPEGAWFSRRNRLKIGAIWMILRYINMFFCFLVILSFIK